MRLRMRLAAVVATLALAGPAAADPRVSKAIDDHITARLRAEGVAPAGRADDATLVRRIYLDLLGRPPGVAETEAFLDDPAPDKVHVLIERLRLYPESAAHWRRVIAGWLQVRGGRFGDDGLLQYLEQSVAANRGWDRVVHDLLDPHPAGPNDYLARFLGAGDKSGREAAAVAVASAFFGAQLQCARCHDHPTVPAWTKAHFDGMRAFFDRTHLERKTSFVRRPGLDDAKVLVDGPVAKGAVRPMFLDGKTFDPADKPRTRLADHALRPAATHFKRAVVNRVWRQLFGRGLVEPVDMIHAGNPASHPRLFDLLADDFAANQFNFDRLVGSIMHSDAYLRSARWTGPADRRPAPELFAVAELRPLSGPQMAWAVATATGYTADMEAAVRKTRANRRGIGLPPEARAAWEATPEFGRLAAIFRAGSGPASTATQALYLAFDPFPAARLDPKGGRLVAELAADPDDEAVARRAYLAVLSRRPTAEEVAIVETHLRAAKSRADACRDIAWALIAGAEFRFNH